MSVAIKTFGTAWPRDLTEASKFRKQQVAKAGKRPHRLIEPGDRPAAPGAQLLGHPRADEEGLGDALVFIRPRMIRLERAAALWTIPLPELAVSLPACDLAICSAAARLLQRPPRRDEMNITNRLTTDRG